MHSAQGLARPHPAFSQPETNVQKMVQLSSNHAGCGGFVITLRCWTSWEILLWEWMRLGCRSKLPRANREESGEE